MSLATLPNGRYADAALERLFTQYAYDRAHGFSHAKIVADGPYGPFVEHFGVRYATEEEAYAAARKRDAWCPEHDRTVFGAPLRAGT